MPNQRSKMTFTVEVTGVDLDELELEETLSEFDQHAHLFSSVEQVEAFFTDEQSLPNGEEESFD